MTETTPQKSPEGTAASEISQSRVLKGGFVVAVGLMAAQAAGFARQAALGYLLGTGPEADALSAAMAPVELWWSVLSLTVIFGFVPKLAAKGPLGGYSFRDIRRPVARLSLASSAAMFVFADPLATLIAPGMDEPTSELAAGLCRVFAAAPAAVGVTFAYSALLFSRRRFFFGSMHHAVINIATIAGALALSERFGVYGFAIGYAAGAWLQLGLAHLHCRRIFPDAFEPGTVRKIDVWSLFSGPGPIVAQATAMELNTAVTRAYASTFGLGMTAAFDYGFKLFRVPMALLVVPLSQALLPEISDTADRGSAVRAMKRAAVATFAISAAVMTVMLLLREPITSLLFERGQFGRESTEAVATILLSYMPVILGRGIVDLLSRTLFGAGAYRAPLAASATALAINAAVCAILPSADPNFIGLGAIIGFAVGAVMIVRRVLEMERRHG